MQKENVMIEIRETIKIILIALVLSFIVRTFIVEARVIPSGSMLPTIQLGDRVLVNKFIYRFSNVERGDIVVFEPPIESKDDYIKRVIGLPGETLWVEDGRICIDGHFLNEPYIPEPIFYTMDPITIPENTYFVMGDNRNSSYDSHAWGVLPIENIKGKAFVMYWPIDHIKKMTWEGCFE